MADVPRDVDPDPTRHDLRLAVGAGVAWLGAAVALSGGVRRAVAMAAVAAVVGVATLVSRRPGRSLGPIVALAAFCVVIVLAPLAARLHVTSTSSLARLAAARVGVSADVTLAGDPHLLMARGAAGSPRAIVEAEVDVIRVAGRRVPAAGRVVILGPAGLWPQALPGARYRLDAKLQPPLGGGLLSATLVAESDPQAIGAPPWWQRAAGRVRASMRSACAGLPDQVAGLLPGLIDGDTTGLDPVLAEHFRVAGLTHLVAVSGVSDTSPYSYRGMAGVQDDPHDR